MRWLDNQFVSRGLPRPQKKFATDPIDPIKAFGSGPMLGFKRFRNASISDSRPSNSCIGSGKAQFRLKGFE